MNNFFFLNNIKLRDASMTSKVQIISFPLLQSNYPKKKKKILILAGLGLNGQTSHVLKFSCCVRPIKHLQEILV